MPRQRTFWSIKIFKFKIKVKTNYHNMILKLRKINEENKTMTFNILPVKP